MREQRPAAGELEGLVLCDGSGACYAVPLLVIARYRLGVDELASLACLGPPSSAEEAPGPAWTVHGGVYAPLATARRTEHRTQEPAPQPGCG